MSPRYDPPRRPARRILLGVLACGLVGALGTVLAVWQWSGRATRGSGRDVATEDHARTADRGSQPGSPSSPDGGGAFDPRAQQPPVIGEAQPGAGGTTASSTNPAASSAGAGRSSGAGSSPAAATSAFPPASRDATGGDVTRAHVPAAPTAAIAPAPANLAGTTIGAAAPAPAPVPAPSSAPAPAPTTSNGGNPGEHPEVWSPRDSSDTGTTGHDIPADHADRETDRVPPVLDSIGFDPTQIDDGNPVRLMIRVHDDLAGVRTVTGNIRSPSGRAVFSFEAAQADANGSLYVATISIPPRAETGTWYVGYLYVPDRADNSLVLSYTAATVPPGGTLNVVSRESDSTPPVIHDVVLTSPSVQGGEHNHMRVDIDDDSSGVASIVGSFKSPSGAALIPFICRLVPESQTWEGDVIVPQSADCGQWTVNQILATDKAGNSTVLQNPNPTIEHVGFQVVGNNCDDTAPILDAISMAPTAVSNESASEIIVTASVSDSGSGATSMTGWATGPPATNGVTPKILFACIPSTPSEPGSTWTGKIIVPQYAAKGTWRITRVRLQDRAQNIRDYTQADTIIANAIFVVQ